MNKQMIVVWLLLTAGIPGTRAQDPLDDATPELTGEVERDAMRMFRRGMALMDDRQEDRAVRVLDGVLRNFPRAAARHQAAIELGKYYIEQGEFQMALRQLETVLDSEDAVDEERAESMYRIGICYYEESDFGRALTTLRRVTDSYPWSVFANEAYYYIGLCHFRAERWTRAVEALKMVGTSVPPNESERTLAEAGQRFYVKVRDKDLRVLGITGESVSVQITSDSGDSETVALEKFDTDGEYYLGSIKTEPGKPTAGDGILQFTGGDVVRAVYNDENSLDGAKNVKRIAVSRLVSTASGGFMDGAYREYVRGVFANQPTYLRINDFDADTTAGKDTLTVTIISRRNLTDEEMAEQELSPLEGPYYKLRDQLTVNLTETEAHSGVFTGRMVIEAVEEDQSVDQSDQQLQAVEGDEILLEYRDEEHIDSITTPRTLTFSAEFLIGELPDVWVAHREVQEEEFRARKNLIEAAFFLRLGEIFRDVGLIERAEEKADIGLEKANDVLRRSLRVNLSRDLVEEAYRRKWELEIVKGDLASAISTCRTLMALYPTSSLADVALMQIAKASIDAGNRDQAFRLLRGILSLNTSKSLKAEAQYNIAVLLEQDANERSANQPQQRARMMAPAIQAFQDTLEKFPESPFAGEALGKVIDYHIESRDYERCIELLERAFVDYPDAGFMDEMLFKWGIVEARMQRMDAARERFQRLLRDYPSSRLAGRARQFLDRLGQVGR